MFSKNNPITQPHRKNELKDALLGLENFQENMDIPKLRDQAFYSLLFPFLLDILKTYAIYLTDSKSIKYGKNTEFEESFDVSSIKSVLENTVIQCYVNSLYYN